METVCARATTRFDTIALTIRLRRWADHSSMQLTIDGKEPGTPHIVFFLEESEVQMLAQAINENFKVELS